MKKLNRRDAEAQRKHKHLAEIYRNFFEICLFYLKISASAASLR